MNSYTLVLISFLVLTPIFLLLNFGFTKKGKVLVLGSSLIFSLLGISAQPIFQIWQIALILFLFIILTTFLITKGENLSIFVNLDGYTEKEAELEFFQEDAEDPFKIKPVTENVTVENTLEKVRNDQFLEVMAVSNIPLEVEVDQEYITLDSLGEHEEISRELEEDNLFETLKILEDDTKDDSILSLEKSEVANEIQSPSEEQEPIGNNYLAEIEQIIMKSQDMDYLNGSGSINIDHITNKAANIEQMNSEMDKNNTNILPYIDPFDPILAMEEEALNVESPLGNNNEFNYSEEFSLESLSKTEIENNLVEAPKTDNLSTNDVKREMIQKQLFKTMISQLQLSRKLVDANKYEHMLREHLHPDLPLFEYYTFATLLIQHFIIEKQSEKLGLLLNQLEQKITEYPILVQEIRYLKAIYFEKR